MPGIPIIIPGPSGDLEAAWHAPAEQTAADADAAKKVAIICHPHPLYGGTMQNKVVTTMAKAYNDLGMIAVRFNYRGVGGSAGAYGNINGETQDCLAVLAWAQQQWPHAHVSLAGFSFGAYIAAYAATQTAALQSLLTVAPSVERMPYDSLERIEVPWLIIQGEEDTIVEPQAVYKWHKGLHLAGQQARLIKVPAAGHFFDGKLNELRDIIVKNLELKPFS